MLHYICKPRADQCEQPPMKYFAALKVITDQNAVLDVVLSKWRIYIFVSVSHTPVSCNLDPFRSVI